MALRNLFTSLKNSSRVNVVECHERVRSVIYMKIGRKHWLIDIRVN